jgi:hypothetical protein
MCTVTIIPTGKSNFVLTSNRDEAPDRISLNPEECIINDARMLFPKDKTAGGSWIGVSDKNRVLCVLNGGFAFHQRQSFYRLSRGVVMRDLLACKQIDSAIEAYNLEGVEPFTLVIADWNKGLQFFELVWDGKQKYFNKLPLEAKMWSSSTLYSKDMKQERQQWFSNFKTTNDLNAESLMGFHLNTETKNRDYGVIMDRGFVKTTSITQIRKEIETVAMDFNNLQDKSKSEHLFKLSQNVNG